MRQFKCLKCGYTFDEPTTMSVSYREYYGAKQWTNHYEACSNENCYSTKIEQVFCLIDGPQYSLVDDEPDMSRNEPWLDPQWD